MEKTFTPEQIDIINRVVFSHIDKMTEEVANIVEKTEKAAHQEISDHGINMADFYPANQPFFNDDNRTDIDRPCAWWGHGSCSKNDNYGSEKTECQRKC